MASTPYFGNLYHLSTEDEPEDPDWPSDQGFNARYRPRGVWIAWR